MESNIEFKYNGKVYQAVSDDCDPCNECAFSGTYFDCTDMMDKAQSQTGLRCRGVVWQEKPAGSTETTKDAEPSVLTPTLTWTEQEIREAYFDWTGGLGNLIEILKKRKDPEYQKYLELKAKFGE